MSFLSKFRRVDAPKEKHNHKERAKKAFDTLTGGSGTYKLSDEQKRILQGLREGKSLAECRDLAAAAVADKKVPA